MIGEQGLVTASETNYRERPIMVLGLPRSGTSLVAGCLATCGAWTGQTVGPGPANPKGYFENLRLRDGVNKSILRALGCDPLGVAKLPDLAAVPANPAMRTAISGVIAKEGYTGATPWLFKDAKLTLLWPAWLAMFPAAHWVIVHRAADDIVQSCLNTAFMRQHSEDPSYWHGFIAAYQERLEQLRRAAVWYREIHPADLVAGNFSKLKTLVEDLDLTWDEPALASFVTPDHWHANQ